MSLPGLALPAAELEGLGPGPGRRCCQGRGLRRPVMPQRLMSLGRCGPPSPLTGRAGGLRGQKGEEGGASKGDCGAGRGGWIPRQGGAVARKKLRGKGGNLGLACPPIAPQC